MVNDEGPIIIKERGNAPVQQVESVTQLLSSLGEGFFDVLKEIVRASNSNPLIGLAVVIWFSGLLKKSKVIDETYCDLVTGAVLVAFGIETTQEIISMFPILGWFVQKDGNAELVRPSQTTGVYNDSAKELTALIPLLTQLAGAGV